MYAVLTMDKREPDPLEGVTLELAEAPQPNEVLFVEDRAYVVRSRMWFAASEEHPPSVLLIAFYSAAFSAMARDAAKSRPGVRLVWNRERDGEGNRPSLTPEQLAAIREVPEA